MRYSNLRIERKQMLLRKADNYGMFMILSYISALLVTLIVGVTINIITDNSDLVVDVCTLTFLGFATLGVLCMAMMFIYIEKSHSRNI
tara:strand:+ start:448 stop:711 length:264 start_codon:yes stop_codon:yes gene_type:complete